MRSGSQGQQGFAKEIQCIRLPAGGDRTDVPDHRAPGIEIRGADQQQAAFGILAGDRRRHLLVRKPGDKLPERDACRPASTPSKDTRRKPRQRAHRIQPGGLFQATGRDGLPAPGLRPAGSGQQVFPGPSGRSGCPGNNGRSEYRVSARVSSRSAAPLSGVWEANTPRRPAMWP